MKLTDFFEVSIGILILVGIFGTNVQAQAFWPPVEGREFPDLVLTDQSGKKVKISDYKGSVILVEYVGMNCPACLAFAGARHYGPFENIQPESGLDGIEQYFPRYTKGIYLNDQRIVFIQMLLYSLSMQAPTVDDARKWTKHFHTDKNKNHIVLIGKPSLIGPASYNLIPGFQLIDKNFIVRSDSTGHNPKHSLYQHLLPMVPKLLKEEAR